MSEFRCIRCGFCCLHLRGPMLGQVHGLTLMPHETSLFPGELIKPLFRYLGSDVAWLYQLDVDVCPHYSNGCLIYDRRPMMCRAFPMEVSYFGRLILHESCLEIKRLNADGIPIRSPKEYLEAASKLSEYEATNLPKSAPERFDLRSGWRHMLAGMSKYEISLISK